MPRTPRDPFTRPPGAVARTAGIQERTQQRAAGGAPYTVGGTDATAALRQALERSMQANQSAMGIPSTQTSNNSGSTSLQTIIPGTNGQTTTTPYPGGTSTTTINNTDGSQFGGFGGSVQSSGDLSQLGPALDRIDSTVRPYIGMVPEAQRAAVMAAYERAMSTGRGAIPRAV